MKKLMVIMGLVACLTIGAAVEVANSTVEDYTLIVAGEEDTDINII